MPKPDNSAGHLAHIDGLRGFAALWVLAFHCWNFGFLTEGVAPSWAAAPLAAGHLGVPVFLVISGFCLAYPYVKKGATHVEVRSFAIRRLIRIAPPYWICTLAFAALSIAIGRIGFFHVHAVQQETDLKDVAIHLAMVQNLFPDHFFRINGALWSVALECQLYLVFPILMLWSCRPRLLLLACGAVSLAAWAWAVSRGANGGDARGMVLWSSAPSYLIIFGLGIAAAGWYQADLARKELLGYLGFLCLAISVVLDRFDGNFPAGSLITTALGTTCLLLAGAGSPSGSVLSAALLTRIGLVSYTLYLIHNPIVSFGGKVLRPRLNGLPLAGGMVLFAVIAIGLAFVLYPVLERPFHLLARRLPSRGRPVPVAEAQPPEPVAAT